MLKKNKLTGERIKNLRKEKGMTQEELALAVGYSGKAAIARIESGDNGVSIKKLIAIAGALDVSPDYLTGASELPYKASTGRPAAKELIARISNPDCYTQLSDFQLDRLTYFLNNPDQICIDQNDLLIEILSNKMISENEMEVIISYGNKSHPGNQCEYSVYIKGETDPIIIFKCYINHFEPTLMLKWFKVMNGNSSCEIVKVVMEELIKISHLLMLNKFYVGDSLIDCTKTSHDDEDYAAGEDFFNGFDYGNMKLEINK